ncbi:MAG: hypothetical protein AB1758_25770 [Candidatus Eremiobacterota bacterium]
MARFGPMMQGVIDDDAVRRQQRLSAWQRAQQVQDPGARAALEQSVLATPATRWDQAADPVTRFQAGQDYAPQTIRQVGTDGQVREFAMGPRQRARFTPQTQAGQMMQRVFSGETPAQEPYQPRTQTGRRMQEAMSAGYRGLSGVTTGTVNGRQVAVPEAGQGSAFRESMGRLGLLGNDVVDLGSVDKRATEMAEAERQRSLDDYERETQRQVRLARIKNMNTPQPPKTGLEVRRDYIRRFNEDLQSWGKDQQEARRVQGAISAALRASGGDVDAATVKIGKQEMTVPEARSLLQGLQRLRPTRETWASDYGIEPEILDPYLGQVDYNYPVSQARASAPRQQPTPSEQSFASGYSASQLARIPPASRAVAVQRLRQAGDEEAAAYLEGLQ